MHTNRPVAALVSLALIGAVLEPVIREPWEDSFPLSPYAMFAFKRKTELTMDYAVGFTAAGERRALDPWLVGSGEVLQALTILQRARAANQLPQLCATIARRVAADADFDEVAEIRILTGTHDAVDYLVRHLDGKEQVRTTCRVPR